MAQQVPEKDDAIRTSPGLIKVDPSKGQSLSEARTVLQQNLNLALNNDFKLENRDTDPLGFVHHRFQQTYKGVAVAFAKPTVHAKDGKIVTISGEFYDIIEMSVEPQLNASAAFAKAIAHTAASSYLWEDVDASRELGYEKPSGELLLLPVFEGEQVTVELAYKFEIFTIVPLGGGDLYIDAIDGRVLFFNNRVLHLDNFGHDGRALSLETAEEDIDTEVIVETFEAYVAGSAATRYSGTRTIETTASGGNFTLNDAGRSVFTRNANNLAPIGSSLPYITNYSEFTDSDNNWIEYDNADKDNAALDAHWGAMQTYDYWQTVHNRDSYDNAGAQLRSYVHVDNNYDNAFWFLSVMSYGDGSSNGSEGNGFFDALTSLDVAAHEIGHAVTQFTANLAYQRESGGLNEGYSDVWGAAVEHFAKGNGVDTAPDPEIWLIGDEIDRRNGSAALRSMSDPKSLGQPDTYGGTFWINPNCGTPTQSNDYCGVHTNSGVLNHWFYLSVAGGSGTNDVGDVYTVAGIGMDKAAKIAYRGINNYMSANTTFAQARTALIQSAIDLYGAGGLEEIAITNAMYAVNVGDDYGGGGGSSYCSSASTNVNDEYIGRVQVGTIDNTSGAQFYTDFTSVSTSLSEGSTYTVTVTPVWTGTIYNEGYAVWIDYNNDNDFSDAGELVWSQAASTATPVSGSFTVPSGTSATSTRMRVSMKYNGVPTACETFTYGEVEDYTVDLTTGTIDTQDPTTPTNVSASNIQTNTATISWTASTDNVGVSGYEVFRSGVSQGTTAGASFNATGLSPATSYTYAVSAFDAAGNTSGLGSISFTTQSAADTQDPTTPTSLTVGAIGNTTVDLLWNAATDNVGVTGYDVYEGANLAGTTSNTSFQVTGLTASTTYSFTVRARDAAGNTSASSNLVTATTTGGGGSPVVLHEGYFESGWDGWADGGGDSFRYSGGRSYEGSYSIRIRDNSNSSVMTLSNVDLTGYNNVEVDFFFFPNSMENGEDFWLQYNSGSGWVTVASYVRGTDFNNNTFYNATVTLDSGSYSFPSNAQFRFRCDASNNADRIYIDAVTITANAPATLTGDGIVALSTPQGFTNLNVDENEFEGEIQLYPNPTNGLLNIEMIDANATMTYRIVNLLGQQVKQGTLTESIDVSNLQAGMYIIEINDGEDVVNERFIKQ
ncbi:MAG: Zn-dependent metalloprotease/chitodextrinase [Dokdonia sp.]|jgi:Zn-dependent metalloprotease/chitodextrinase